MHTHFCIVCRRALKDANKVISLTSEWPKGYFRKGKALAVLKVGILPSIGLLICPSHEEVTLSPLVVTHKYHQSYDPRCLLTHSSFRLSRHSTVFSSSDNGADSISSNISHRFVSRVSICVRALRSWHKIVCPCRSIDLEVFLRNYVLWTATCISNDF